MSNERVVHELLSRCPLFRSLSTEALAAVRAAGIRTQLGGKEIVFRQGDAGDSIYFLLSGGAKISMQSRDGKEIILDVLTSGEFFGDMSLFDNKRRTGTVTTLVASDLLMLGKHAFLDLLDAHPRVSLDLIATLVSRLRLMDALLEDVLFLDAETRIAKRVMALSDIYGRSDGNGDVRIDLKMSQQEIANLVGITRESVNKYIRGWETLGTVAMDKGCLVLKQPDRLKALITPACA